jgi:hypothetical protein
LMCGDNNHKLHDLCACVDVWKQQINKSFCFSCGYVNVLSFLFCMVVSIWGKNQQRWNDCVKDMTQKEGPFD